MQYYSQEVWIWASNTSMLSQAYALDMAEMLFRHLQMQNHPLRCFKSVSHVHILGTAHYLNAACIAAVVN